MWWKRSLGFRACCLFLAVLSMGCTHTLTLRDQKAMVKAPLSQGTLIVLPFENKTDRVYEDGFWFESVEDPVAQLTSLYGERLEKSGLFAEVKRQDQTLAEVLKASGALKKLKQPVFILSGEVSHFRSQMHAHWYAFILPTSFLTPFAFPFPPAWGACDIEAKFQLTRWNGQGNPAMATEIQGRAYRSHFGATYWTEHLLFVDMVQQASNQTVDSLAVGVKHSLFQWQAEKRPSTAAKKADR